MMYLEIRPGEGGDDAALFASQLTDAVLAYAARHGIKAEKDGNALILNRGCL